ncbi:MAG: hypothetical protein SGBAC_006175 [Bacillariaceae sp.]
MEAFTSALLILETVLGTFHLLTAKTYFWIGFILQKSSSSSEKTQKDYRRCLDAFSMALRIRLRMCGASHKSTEEARQAVRWAFRKMIETNQSEDSIEDFFISIEKCLRYEARGDKKFTAKDYQAALLAFEKASLTASPWEQYTRPTPQLMFKMGDCYASLDEIQNATYWFRRALLDIHLWDPVHHHKHPVAQTAWEQLKKSVPAESLENYIEMTKASMQHIKFSQEKTGWASQEDLLKAIQLELVYADSKDPFVKYLVDQINLRAIRNELSSQVTLADDGILQLALSFDRKDTNTSEKLDQLDEFQKRAAACLQIATDAIGETCVPSNGILPESWNGEEAMWLSRQVHAMELLQLHVSGIQGKNVKKSNEQQSKKVDFLTEEVARLEADWIGIQNKLNSTPSKLKKGDRESLISQMAETQQEIAFRECQLELEQQQSSEESSFPTDISDQSCESLVKIKRYLAQGKQELANLGPDEKSDEATIVDKSSFWNDSFEAGLWKYPRESKKADGFDEIAPVLETDLGTVKEGLTIRTEQNEHFDSYISPKTMEETESPPSNQTNLDDALRQAKELFNAQERNDKQLEDAKSARESCNRMLDQYNSAPITEKTFLIKNLVAASEQEVEHFTKKKLALENKFNGVQCQIEALQQRLQTAGESTQDALPQWQEVVKSDLQEESNSAATPNQMEQEPRNSSLHKPLLAINDVQTQGVLSHAPSVHKSLVSAMQQLDYSMDKKLEASFHGIDTFLLNPKAAASDLTSTMQTARNQALRRLDGCYSELSTDRSRHSFAQENTTLSPIGGDSVKVTEKKLTGLSSVPSGGIVPIEDIRKRIRRYRFTFHSPSGKFIMRRPSIDVSQWGNEADTPVSKEYNANAACPETVDVMVQIAYDRSTLLLSSDSVVHHRSKGGEWKNLGPIDQRDIPFGWVRVAKRGGSYKSSYSLGK